VSFIPHILFGESVLNNLPDETIILDTFERKKRSRKSQE